MKCCFNKLCCLQWEMRWLFVAGACQGCWILFRQMLFRAFNRAKTDSCYFSSQIGLCKLIFIFSARFSCHASSRAGQNGIHCSYSNMRSIEAGRTEHFTGMHQTMQCCSKNVTGTGKEGMLSC